MPNRPCQRGLSLIAAALLFLQGCAVSSSEIVPLGEGTLPAKLQQEQDELRAETQRAHQYYVDRRAFYESPALEAYLQEIAQKLVPNLQLDENTKIQFKVLRDPTLNASAMLTGHIYFHSGIFSKLKNEDQLAFVMAHEISHVQRRDILYYVQNLKRKTVSFKLADIILTPAASMFGAGGLSSLGLSLMYAGSVTGYGREKESAADALGIEKLLAAGYDPDASLSFFDDLLNEKNNYQKGLDIFFLSSHPSNERRKNEVRVWMAANQGRIDTLDIIEDRTDRYRQLTYELRRENAILNESFGRFYHALDDIQSVLAEKPSDPVAHYYQGLIYLHMTERRQKIKDELSKERWKEVNSVERVKQEGEWLAAAIQSFQRSIDLDGAYAPPYKGMGEYYLKKKMFKEAESSFKRYLELAPQALDRRSVQRYLKDISSPAALPEKL